MVNAVACEAADAVDDDVVQHPAILSAVREELAELGSVGGLRRFPFLDEHF